MNTSEKADQPQEATGGAEGASASAVPAEVDAAVQPTSEGGTVTKHACTPKTAAEISTNVIPELRDNLIDQCLESGEDDEEEEEGEDEEEIECEEAAETVPPSKEASSIAHSTKRFRRHHFIKHEICIPDKDRPARPVPKGRPRYLHKKTALEKRQDSGIAFVMPKQEDPEVIALRKTNKMVQKLIKYMKKSWKVRVDRKQEDRELEHRTLASVYTRKPDDWLERIHAREQRALETGFFSGMDVPYESLIDLELDTALLTFKNLPPDLKITAARWIRTKLRKEELKRKRDAYLPRLPHGKVKRPSYNKGRLIKDPGGVLKVDQFVKVADGFQRVTKGNTTFSKALKDWSQKKEKENYNMNSGFGIVREGMFDFSRKPNDVSQGPADDEQAPRNLDHRRDSIVDGRKYQRDMLHFEKVMSSIYEIMKCLLNIKAKQLESKFPLPPEAVNQIRADSPDRAEKKKHVPLLLLKREAALKPRASVVGFGRQSYDMRKSLAALAEEEMQQANNPVPLLTKADCPLPMKPDLDVRKSIADFAVKVARKSDFKARMSVSQMGGETVNVDDVINISPVRTTTQLVKDIKSQHTYEDALDVHARKNVLTAEQKIKRLMENPEHAAIRRARNYMTYTKLFERHSRKVKRPVWHNIDITETDFDLNGEEIFSFLDEYALPNEKDKLLVLLHFLFQPIYSLDGKDPAHLTEADAAEIVETALMRRKQLAKSEDNETKRWPEEHDIPTPTFPFPRSKIKIPSEEQSRQNLLKKTPHMDEVPSTPVRRLYKLAGIRTTEKDIFTNIMDMKRLFRVTEHKLRVYYENEIGKLDWDTLKRFRSKLDGIHPSPVYQWTIGLMRLNHDVVPDTANSRSSSADVDDQEQKKLHQRRPALWYKKLQEEAEMNGALRHNGCSIALTKLLKYCDVDMKTRPHMLNRLALFVVSLPTTELGTIHWQEAVVFLLEYMFGTPPEIINQWLKYRGIPFLL